MNKNDTRANERNNNNIDNCCNHSSATLGLIPATVVAVEPGFAARNFVKEIVLNYDMLNKIEYKTKVAMFRTRLLSS